jgi:hypothetical protein
MSILTRHLAIINYVDEAFSINDISITEDLIKHGPTLSAIDQFFTTESPSASLYLAYLSPKEAVHQKCCVMRVKYRRNSLSNEHSTGMKNNGRRNSVAKKFVAENDKTNASLASFEGNSIHEPLGFIQAFFTEAVEGSENRPIAVLTKVDAKAEVDAEKSGDNQLFYGLVKQPLQSLDAIVRNLIVPLLKQGSAQEWGKANDIQKTIFV